jgi:hypothetical protein
MGLVFEPGKAACYDAAAIDLAIDNANVSRALPATSWIVLDVELDLLSFLERVELTRTEGGVVEEDLAAILRADEAEPTVSNQTNYWTCCHDVVLLCRALSKRASTRATGDRQSSAC